MQNKLSFNFDFFSKALLPMSPPHGGGAYEEIREAELQ
jgi:hypothetical protein